MGRGEGPFLINSPQTQMRKWRLREIDICPRTHSEKDKAYCSNFNTKALRSALFRFPSSVATSPFLSEPNKSSQMYCTADWVQALY